MPASRHDARQNGALRSMRFEVSAPHPAWFCVPVNLEIADRRELSLSGDVSEWLFHVGFWGCINDAYGTEFDQYEDGVFPADRIAAVASGLRDLRERVSKDEIEEVTITYGWTQDGEPLTCTVSMARVTLGLWELIDFLDFAQADGRDVYWQL